MRFAGKIAMITGAAGGIGKAASLNLAAEGADLVLIDLNVEGLEELKLQIESIERKVHCFKADVTVKEQAEQVFRESDGLFGRLDILVNNVGANIQKPALELSETEWDYLIDVNLKSMFLYSQLAGKRMIEQKSGVIINISSILGLGGVSRRAAYSCAKTAVNSLTQTLACEWALDGVRVNAIAPGYILTELLQKFFDEGTLNPENMLRRTPQGRLGTPEDIARSISFLASDEAAFITGTLLYVDGGYSAYHGAEPVPSRW